MASILRKNELSNPEGTPPNDSWWRRVRRWVLQALIVLGVFLTVSHWQTRDLLPHGETLAPQFALSDLEGRVVRLSDYQGKSVLLHFWATWCGVCRQEVGTLNALLDSLDEDQVLLTVVANGHDRDAVQTFMRERGVRYPVLLGSDAIIDQYRITIFPTNYFLDAEGHVTSTTVGMSTRWSFKARMGCGS